MCVELEVSGEPRRRMFANCLAKIFLACAAVAHSHSPTASQPASQFPILYSKKQRKSRALIFQYPKTGF